MNFVFFFSVSLLISYILLVINNFASHNHLIRIGGNNFKGGEYYPTWNTPLEAVPTEQNISRPPKTQSNAIESYLSFKSGGGKKKKKLLGFGGIVSFVGGVTLLAICTAVLIAIHINQSQARNLKNVEISKSSLHSIQVKGEKTEDLNKHHITSYRTFVHSILVTFSYIRSTVGGMLIVYSKASNFLCCNLLILKGDT